MKTFTKLSILVLFFQLFISCSKDKDDYLIYNDINKLTGFYEEGTRTILIKGDIIPEENNKPYKVYITNGNTKNQLKANLNFPQPEDVLDHELIFSGFKVKGNSSSVEFSINTTLSRSSLKGDQIPQFIIDYFQFPVVEIRDLYITYGVGKYDPLREEITFEGTGSFIPYFEDGSHITPATSITIVYTIK